MLVDFATFINQKKSNNTLNMNTTVGILGSGSVAKALGAGFIKHGYEVMLGTTNVDKLAEWKTQNEGVQIGTFEEAAKFGRIVVIAVKGHAAVDVLKAGGIDNLKGKIVIDTNNPIDDNIPPQNGVLSFFTGPNESLMERLQAAAPEAHLVKAFNSIGAHLMVNPVFTEQPTMFICGNSAEAKIDVAEILGKFGFDVQDMGKVESARALEPLCTLWCIPGFLHNDWKSAFRFIRD